MCIKCAICMYNKDYVYDYKLIYFIYMYIMNTYQYVTRPDFNI